MDHPINLTVSDVIRNMSEMKNVLASIRQIVMYTRDSHFALEMLNKYQKAFGKHTQIWFCS
jgi:hypothetical protein